MLSITWNWSRRNVRITLLKITDCMRGLYIVPCVSTALGQRSDMFDGRGHIVRLAQPPVNFISADTARPCVHFEDHQCDNVVTLRIDSPALGRIILDRLSDLWQTNHSFELCCAHNPSESSVAVRSESHCHPCYVECSLNLIHGS